MSRTAIVLFNLGGPDNANAVRPFLFNLFNDPAIIRLPGPLRFVIAYLIARRRAPIARDIYDKLGGGSPLVENTLAQARALEAALADLGEILIVPAMRYWHPMSDEAAQQVKDFAPDRILLLPLYPQWSTTTTASSIAAWQQAARAIRLDVPTTRICCYPAEAGFLDAAARRIRPALAEASAHGKPRLLLSAHGLPKKIVASGDPYQWQCKRTASALVDRLGIAGLDWSLCYQSRVGPLEWIGPSTDAEVRRAGTDGVPLVVFPLAFVSEHSETLVEIEIEYRHLAEGTGVPHFVRVPAVGDDPAFIAGLARLVRGALAQDRPLCSDGGGRICPAAWSGCAFAAGR